VSILCPIGVDTRIHESERNRPTALRNDAPAGGEAVSLIGRVLAPETVAEMALAAIRENRLYVITHEEGLEPLRRRARRLEQAILERKP
jgi:short-subunit dehydrogenase